MQEATEHLVGHGLRQMTVEPEVEAEIGEMFSTENGLTEEGINELEVAMDKAEEWEEELNSELLRNIEEIKEKIHQRIAANLIRAEKISGYNCSQKHFGMLLLLRVDFLAFFPSYFTLKFTDISSMAKQHLKSIEKKNYFL